LIRLDSTDLCWE